VVVVGGLGQFDFQLRRRRRYLFCGVHACETVIFRFIFISNTSSGEYMLCVGSIGRKMGPDRRALSDQVSNSQ
jgi:hypothetical protein